MSRKHTNSGLDDFTKAAIRRADFIRQSSSEHHAEHMLLIVKIVKMVEDQPASAAAVALVGVLCAMILELHGNPYEQQVDVAALGVLMQETLDHGIAERIKQLRELAAADLAAAESGPTQ